MTEVAHATLSEDYAAFNRLIGPAPWGRYIPEWAELGTFGPSDVAKVRCPSTTSSAIAQHWQATGHNTSDDERREIGLYDDDNFELVTVKSEQLEAGRQLHAVRRRGLRETA